jgi:uncharacterized protein YhhL (DUF1145 family)
VNLKWLVAAAWIVSIACFFLDPALLAVRLGRLVFWLMAVAHAVECAVFLPRLRRAAGPLGRHLWLTFLFGFFHLREVGSETSGAAR